MTDILSNTTGITDGLSPLKSFRELENNYMTLPLTNIDRITHKLSSSKSFRELKKNYMTLPLIITNKITNIKKITDFPTNNYRRNH